MSNDIIREMAYMGGVELSSLAPRNIPEVNVTQLWLVSNMPVGDGDQHYVEITPKQFTDLFRMKGVDAATSEEWQLFDSRDAAISEVENRGNDQEDFTLPEPPTSEDASSASAEQYPINEAIEDNSIVIESAMVGTTSASNIAINIADEPTKKTEEDEEMQEPTEPKVSSNSKIVEMLTKVLNDAAKEHKEMNHTDKHRDQFGGIVKNTLPEMIRYIKKGDMQSITYANVLYLSMPNWVTTNIPDEVIMFLTNKSNIYKVSDD